MSTLDNHTITCHAYLMTTNHKPSPRVIMAFTTATNLTVTVTQWDTKQTVTITHPLGIPCVYDAEAGVALPTLGKPAQLHLIMKDGSYSLIRTAPVTSLIYL